MTKGRKLIPLTFIALAIIGAFTTQAMNRSATTLVQGYIRGNPQGTSCLASIWCSTDGNQICMVGTTQVWGKSVNGQCILEVYRAPE